MLDAGTLKAVQDNVPLLRDDPRPMTARRLEYEIIADSVMRILGIRPND